MPSFSWPIWPEPRVKRALAEAPPDILEDFELLLLELRKDPRSRRLGASPSPDRGPNVFTVRFGRRNSILLFEVLNEPVCIHLLMLAYQT